MKTLSDKIFQPVEEWKAEVIYIEDVKQFIKTILDYVNNELDWATREYIKKLAVNKLIEEKQQ